MGNFDGVHFGHQHIFHLVRNRAQELNGTSVVMTFDPHPQRILFPEREFYLINHIKEKIDIIRRIGIDVAIRMKFTREFAGQNPEDFVRNILVKALRIQEIYVGYDSHFGQRQQGSPALLRQWGNQYGFRTVIVPPISRNGYVVSSTKIRQCIREGKIEEAAILLNRPYALDGVVVAGKKRGASLLGFPTANIEVLHELLPKNGVYICQVIWKENVYPAVVNIGTNPTFRQAAITVEAYLLNFHKNLYGEQIKAVFLKRIRDEIVFSNPHDLAAQITQDTHAAETYFRAQLSSS
jgi:riboflavin kinase/FMN adenylyltransferase